MAATSLAAFMDKNPPMLGFASGRHQNGAADWIGLDLLLQQGPKNCVGHFRRRVADANGVLMVPVCNPGARASLHAPTWSWDPACS